MRGQKLVLILSSAFVSLILFFTNAKSSINQLFIDIMSPTVISPESKHLNPVHTTLSSLTSHANDIKLTPDEEYEDQPTEQNKSLEGTFRELETRLGCIF